MKKLLFFLIFLFSANTFYAQNIFLGTKSYPTTGIWSFKNAPDPKWGSISHDVYSGISIAKNNNSGMLVITSEAFSQDYKIVGPVIVYFKNGKAISINSVRSRDYSDGSATTIFMISTIQIKDFINYDIDKIRFNKSFRGTSAEGISTYNSYEKFEGLNRLGLPYYSSQVNNTSSDVGFLFN